ncbi:DUF6799 domain-containing protein [Flavobacterium sp. LB3P45]|uniref:DUF6799 domain-containing protein n=1 Tax=Flavobacterium fructosi TaxID=3230416 RepID=A0ABW6HIS9_9FLAO
MEKIIFASVALCCSMCLFAQLDSTKNKMHQGDKDHHRMTVDMPHQDKYQSYPDGVMMKNGKMMMVKDGKMTVMNQDMTLSNGIKIIGDGTIMKKNGTKMMMREGQRMDMSGNITTTKTQKIISRKTSAKQSSTNTKKNKDMYLIPNDKLKKDTLK